MERKFELNPPMMPNFISIKMPIGKRKDGFKPAPQVAVSDLSKDEAEEYAELMKQTFIAHWQNKTNVKNVV